MPKDAKEKRVERLGEQSEKPQVEKERTVSPAGSSTHSSETEVDNEKSRVILVAYRVDTHPSSIKFYVNGDQRAETWLGQDQGDHITSYLTILHAILASTNGNTKFAMEALRSFGKNILSSDEHQEFAKIKEPITYDHASRKAGIAKLRELSILSSTECDALDATLKHGKLAMRAQYLAELTTFILSSLQQQELATVFSRGRLNKNTAEGADAKTAARALVALDQLCRLCELDNEQLARAIPKLLKSLSARGEGELEDEHIMRYGINAFYGERASDKQSNVEQLKVALARDSTIDEKRKYIVAQRDKLLEKTGEIAEYVGALYDYKRVLEFDLRSVLPSGSKKEPQEELRKYFPKEDNQHVVSGSNVHIIRKNERKLYNTVARHLEIIEAAYPALAKQDIFREKVPDAFMRRCVLNDSGWNDHIVETQKGRKIVRTKLTLEELKEGVDAERKEGSSKEQQKGRQ